MTYGDWEPKRRIEETYRREIKSLMSRFAGYLGPLALTDPGQIIDALRSFFGTEAFGDLAHAAASRMITGLFVDGARTWREAARESMRGRMIYQALQQELAGPVGARVRQLVAENARLITTFDKMRIGNSRTLAQQTADWINAEAYKGRRASQIAEDLKKQLPELADSRVTLIARTETSKASTALTRARSEEFGWDWYVWRTAKDARTRKAHQHFDGVLVSWNDPPAPESFIPEIKSSLGHYHAGDSPNCRCYPEPLLRLDQVQWPHKVYKAGIIKPMTRARFARLAGGELRNAA
jgi:SPP1 gp7 family putative phage head morphogenesis protein